MCVSVLCRGDDGGGLGRLWRWLFVGKRNGERLRDDDETERCWCSVLLQVDGEKRGEAKREMMGVGCGRCDGGVV